MGAYFFFGGDCCFVAAAASQVDAIAEEKDLVLLNMLVATMLLRMRPLGTTIVVALFGARTIAIWAIDEVQMEPDMSLSTSYCMMDGLMTL